MTEEIARGKVCHKRLPKGLVSASIELNCIASRCMAWRWHEKWARDREDKSKKLWKGHCGLAGYPTC